MERRFVQEVGAKICGLLLATPVVVEFEWQPFAYEMPSAWGLERLAGSNLQELASSWSAELTPWFMDWWGNCS